MVVSIKENLVTIIIIAGFTFLLGVFVYTFSEQMSTTSREATQKINQTTDEIVEIAHDLSSLMEQQVTLVQQERNETKQNLALFLGTFANQSDAQVNATQHLEKAVVETLEKSQNLTQYSHNLTEERIEVERETSEKLDELSSHFGNLTLTPNATVVSQ